MARRRRNLLKLSTIAFLLTTSIAVAQTSRGTLAGTVTDPGGAAVANATVVAKDNAGADNRTVTTNSVGEYRIESINPSTYTVTVTAPGFASTKMENVRVEASVATSINPRLELGPASQTVEVSAAAQTIQADSGEIAKTASAAEVQNLPLASLNPIELVGTEPGVTIPAPRESFTDGVGFSVNGLRPRSNNFLLDGTDNNDSGVGGQALRPINAEAIREVIFLTNAYAPEFGRGGASVTNVIYKSGTNEYHGAAWEMYSGAALNAIQSQQHQQGLTSVPNFVDNTFGFDVGGPIKKNQLFLFGSSQWYIDHADESGSPLIIPTAAGVAALQSIGPNSNATLLLNSLGGLVAPSGSSSVNNINIGNRAGCGNPCLIQVGDVIRQATSVNDGYQYVVRADYAASERDTFSGRFVASQNSLSPDLISNSTALPSQDTYQGGPARNLAGFWTHVFSPTKLNEIRFTAQQVNLTFGFLNSTLASPMLNDPAISIAGLVGGVYGGPSASFPQGEGHNNFQYQEAFSWTVGHHNIKMGVDFVHLAVSDNVAAPWRGQVMVRAGGSCSAIGLATCTGLANFLDDDTGPSGTYAKFYGNPFVSFPQTLQNYYFQDNWKVRPNFTLTYGLRYEYEGTPFNALPYPAVNMATVLTDPYPLRVPEKPDKNNFGPRAGFAYTPTKFKNIFGNDKTVFRGGFGVFYDALFTNMEDNQATKPPSVLGGTLTAPNTGRGASGLLSLVSSVAPTVNPLVMIDTIPSNLVNPLIYQWNFNIERQLPDNFFATAAYVGTRGERLYLDDNLNPEINGVAANPNRGVIFCRCNYGNSSYNGLQLDLARRFIRGLLLHADYTFSKAIDNGSEVYFIQTTSNLMPQDPLNIGAERSLSYFDHRHRAAISWVYELPYAKGNGPLSYATKGWRISGTVQLQSGSPTTVFTGFSPGTGFANGRPDDGNSNAPINYSPACLESTTCITGVGQYNANGSITDFKTGAAGTLSQFRYIVPLANQFGNVGRNTVENPGTIATPIAVFRSFAIPKLEGHRLEFRAEAFDPLNHANAGDLDGTIGDTTFLNKSVTYTGGRSMRLWLYYRF